MKTTETIAECQNRRFGQSNSISFGALLKKARICFRRTFPLMSLFNASFSFQVCSCLVDIFFFLIFPQEMHSEIVSCEKKKLKTKKKKKKNKPKTAEN